MIERGGWRVIDVLKRPNTLSEGRSQLETLPVHVIHRYGYQNNRPVVLRQTQSRVSNRPNWGTKATEDGYKVDALLVPNRPGVSAWR